MSIFPNQGYWTLFWIPKCDLDRELSTPTTYHYHPLAPLGLGVGVCCRIINTRQLRSNAPQLRFNTFNCGPMLLNCGPMLLKCGPIPLRCGPTPQNAPNRSTLCLEVSFGCSRGVSGPKCRPERHKGDRVGPMRRADLARYVEKEGIQG